ncbi:MAG: hypothetical protein AAGJ82_02640, partial [Bacteroidota bacterium]
ESLGFNLSHFERIIASRSSNALYAKYQAVAYQESSRMAFAKSFLLAQVERIEKVSLGTIDSTHRQQLKNKWGYIYQLFWRKDMDWPDCYGFYVDDDIYFIPINLFDHE